MSDTPTTNRSKHPRDMERLKEPGKTGRANGVNQARERKRELDKKRLRERQDQLIHMKVRERWWFSGLMGPKIPMKASHQPTISI